MAVIAISPAAIDGLRIRLVQKGCSELTEGTLFIILMNREQS